MSDSDSPEKKRTARPLTAKQQLSNLVNGILDEEGCPEKDRMTTKELARWEEMRKALDESRVNEREAKDFLERLRENLAEAEPPEMSASEIQRVREKIHELATEGFVARMERTLAKESRRKKGKFIN